MNIQYKLLSFHDLNLMNDLLDCFGTAFEEEHVYSGSRPEAEYMKDLLKGDTFIALAAMHEGQLVGGLAAYELKKFE